MFMMDMCLKMDVISDIIHNNQVYVYICIHLTLLKRNSKIQNDPKILKSSLYFTQSKE